MGYYVQNIKFSSEMLSRLVSLIEKLQFSEKITKIMKNIKFSNEMPYRLLSLLEKL